MTNCTRCADNGTPATCLREGERTPDIERVEKAVQSVQFAVGDLRELVSSRDPLLGELALRELEAAVGLEMRLRRVLSLLQPESSDVG